MRRLLDAFYRWIGSAPTLPCDAEPTQTQTLEVAQWLYADGSPVINQLTPRILRDFAKALPVSVGTLSARSNIERQRLLEVLREKAPATAAELRKTHEALIAIHQDRLKLMRLAEDANLSIGVPIF